MAKSKKAQEQEQRAEQDEKKKNFRHNFIMILVTVFCCICFVGIGILASVNLNKKPEPEEEINENVNYSRAELKYSDGNYLIENYKDLQLLSDYVNKGEPDKYSEGKLISQANFVLTADIDCINNFVPIGTAEHPFMGNFFGGGNFINNLRIVAETENVGLFGVISGATISALGITGGEINIPATIDNYSAGGVAGKSVKSTIINCFNSANVINANAVSGGIVGTSVGENIITNCYNTGKITSKMLAGGIVGESIKLSSDKINNCYNIGLIKSAVADGIITNSANAVGNNNYCFLSCGADTAFKKLSVLNMSGEDAVTSENKMKNLLGYFAEPNSEDILYFPQLECFKRSENTSYHLNKFVPIIVFINFSGAEPADAVFVSDRLAAEQKVVPAKLTSLSDGKLAYVAQIDVIYGEEFCIGASVWYSQNSYNLEVTGAKVIKSDSSALGSSVYFPKDVALSESQTANFVLTQLHYVTINVDENADGFIAGADGNFGTEEVAVLHPGKVRVLAELHSGYKFNGTIWQTQIGKIEDSTKAETEVINITQSGEIELTNIAAVRYQIRYDLCGGELLSGDYPDSFTIKDEIVFPTAEKLTKANSVFLGWITNTTLSGTGFSESGGYVTGIKTGSFNSDVVLSANWISVSCSSKITKEYGFNPSEVTLYASVGTSGNRSYNFSYEWRKVGEENVLSSTSILEFSSRFNAGEHDYVCTVTVYDPVTGGVVTLVNSNVAKIVVTPKPVEVKRTDTLDITYDGHEHSPVLTLIGVLDGDDATINLSADSTYFAVEPAVYYIFVEGLKGNDAGNYCLKEGTTKSVRWQIYKAALGNATLEQIEDVVYTGEPVEPAVNFRFEKGNYCGVQPVQNEDYEIVFGYGTDHTNVGKVTAYVYSKYTSTRFTGSAKIEFHIIPDSGAEVVVDAKESYYYMAAAPELVINKLTANGKDEENYQITSVISSEIGRFTAEIVVTSGNFKGSKGVINYQIVCPEIKLVSLGGESLGSIFLKYGETKIYGDAFAENEIDAITLGPVTGYNFVGFTNGSGQTVTGANGELLTAFDGTSGDVWTASYAAKDVVINLVTITDGVVSLDGGSVYVNLSLNSGTVKFGDTITLSANPLFGFKFVGWAEGSQDAEFVTTSRRFSYLVETEGEITFYAKFVSATYQININLLGGEKDNVNISFVPSVNDQTINLGAPPTKRGYQFLGYTAMTDCAVVSADNTSVVILAGTQEDIELTAVWSPVAVAVNFSVQAGEMLSGRRKLFAKYETSALYETELFYVRCSAPTATKTKNGFTVTFVGWAINGEIVIDASGKMLPSVAGVTDENGNIISTSEITLSAVFSETANNYKIYYYPYASLVGEEFASYYTNETGETVITLPVLNLDGKTFLGFTAIGENADKLTISDGKLIIPPGFYGEIILRSDWA